MDTTPANLTETYAAAQSAFSAGNFEVAARHALSCAETFEVIGDYDRASDMRHAAEAAEAAAAARSLWDASI